jgi:hypothetical protein
LLEKLFDDADKKQNLMPSIIEALKAYATLSGRQIIVEVLKSSRRSGYAAVVACCWVWMEAVVQFLTLKPSFR